jgi:hypothetical protein
MSTQESRVIVFKQALDVHLDRYIRHSVSSRVAPVATPCQRQVRGQSVSRQ